MSGAGPLLGTPIDSAVAVLRFHRFHVSVAAVRPTLSRLHSEAAVRPSVLTVFSLYPLVTLMDAMRSLDDFLLRGPVTLASRDLGRFRVTCHRPAYLYVSRYLSYLHVTFTIRA